MKLFMRIDFYESKIKDNFIASVIIEARTFHSDDVTVVIIGSLLRSKI